MQRFFDSAAGTLSGGQKQMLAIARALIEPRDLILVDEPTKGLAPAIVGNMIKAFREVKNAGATVLLVEQNFKAARMLGDTVVVMDDGRIVHRGAMDELAADAALQQRLLGLHMEQHG
jgi:branched-chain amino acid transport system ATP-binding protein